MPENSTTIGTPCKIGLHGSAYVVTDVESEKLICTFTTMQVGYVVELNGNKDETDATIHCRPGAKEGMHALIMRPSMAAKIRNGKSPA
jgi:hypothetical protein